MPSNASIIVHPGGELVLQGAHLYNDCDGTWKGIKVLKKGSNRGKVYYLGKKNLIEHTQKEIKLDQPSNSKT